MNSGMKCRRGSAVASVVAGFVLSLVAADLVNAASARPPRPAGKPKGPKPGGPRAKPGPRPPTGARKPPRTVRPGHPKYRKRVHWRAKRRYWHPRYVATGTRYVYTSTGYPYYVGGTSYTVIQPPVGVEVSDERPVVAQEQVEVSEGDVAYCQMLELTEMIHEWRTLNESPEFQERIPPDHVNPPPQIKRLVEKVKDLNSRFDQLSRQAIKDLVAGKDAERELEQAKSTLEDLIEAAEELPEPPRRRPSSGDGKKR